VVGDQAKGRGWEEWLGSVVGKSKERKPKSLVKIVEEEVYTESISRESAAAVGDSGPWEGGGEVQETGLGLTWGLAKGTDKRPSTTTMGSLVRMNRNLHSAGSNLPPKRIVVNDSDSIYARTDFMAKSMCAPRPNTAKLTMEFGGDAMRGEVVSQERNDVEWYTNDNMKKFSIKLKKTGQQGGDEKRPLTTTALGGSTRRLGKKRLNTSSRPVTSPVRSPTKKGLERPSTSLTPKQRHDNSIVSTASSGVWSGTGPSGLTLPRGVSSGIFRPLTAGAGERPLIIDAEREVKPMKGRIRNRFHADRAMYSSTGMVGVDAVGFGQPVSYGEQRKNAAYNRWRMKDDSMQMKREKIMSKKEWKALSIGNVGGVEDEQGVLMLGFVKNQETKKQRRRAGTIYNKYTGEEEEYYNSDDNVWDSDDEESVMDYHEGEGKEALLQFAELVGIALEEEEFGDEEDDWEEHSDTGGQRFDPGDGLGQDAEKRISFVDQSLPEPEAAPAPAQSEPKIVAEVTPRRTSSVKFAEPQPAELELEPAAPVQEPEPAVSELVLESVPAPTPVPLPSSDTPDPSVAVHPIRKKSINAPAPAPAALHLQGQKLETPVPAPAPAPVSAPVAPASPPLNPSPRDSVSEFSRQSERTEETTKSTKLYREAVKASTAIRLDKLREWIVLSQAIARREINDSQIMSMIKTVQREVPFHKSKPNMRPKNKISFTQFVKFRLYLGNHLQEVRKPPECLSDLLDVGPNKVSLIVNVSKAGRAAVIIKKEGADAPTSMDFLGLTTSDSVPPKTVAYTIVDTTVDDDIAVEVVGLKPKTAYNAYTYAEHPHGAPLGNTMESMPSGSTDDAILVQMNIFTTQPPPEPDIIVPWDEMDADEQTTELLAVIKDKKVKAYAKERLVIVPTASDATNPDENARHRWITFQDWWAYELKARRAFCVRELTYAAKNKEIRKDALEDGVSVLDDDWHAVHPGDYDPQSHQFDDVDNVERWLRWREFCLWYRGYDEDEIVGDDSSSSEEESSDKEDDEAEVVAVVEAVELVEEAPQTQAQPQQANRALSMFGGLNKPVQAVESENKEDAVFPSSASATVLNCESTPAPPADTPHPSVGIFKKKPSTSALPAASKPEQDPEPGHESEPELASPVPAAPPSDDTPHPSQSVRPTRKSLVAAASLPVSDASLAVGSVKDSVKEEVSELTITEEAKELKDTAKKAVEGAAREDGEEKKEEYTPTQKSKSVIELPASTAASVIPKPPRSPTGTPLDDPEAVGVSASDALSVISGSIGSGGDDISAGPTPADIFSSTKFPEGPTGSIGGGSSNSSIDSGNVDRRGEGFSVAPTSGGPSPLASMKAASSAKKLKKKSDIKKKKKENKDKIKKAARVGARAKFLGGQTAKIDKAVEKVNSMMKVTDDFEAQEKGLKPKLRGMALLKAKTKAMMMMKKLEQLKGSIKAANAQAASAEDLADVDLFEEVDMSKFEPDPEDARPPTPPVPAYPFFTAWKVMSEEEKVHELKLACMDPDVMTLAVEDDILPPDLEDSASSAAKRSQGWEAFRAWYTESEEFEELSEEDKKKKTPKVAAARKVFSRNEANAALRDEQVMKAGFSGDIVGDEATIDFREWYNSSRSVRSEFLARTAKRLEIARRATIALSIYNLPEAAFFQEIPTLFRDGAPHPEHRIRLYGSRYPETFTWEEVEDWYEEDDVDIDAKMMREAEDTMNAERRRLKLLETELEREKLETEISMWEDQRSLLWRIATDELTRQRNMTGAGDDYLGEKYGYFGALPKDKGVYEGMHGLAYRQGTGLDNRDEFSDDKERAALEAAARARRREEMLVMEANEKKRQELEEKRTKQDEARKKRLQETAAERNRIIKELADIKESRRLAKIEKERKVKEDEEVRKREEKRKLEMEEQERMRVREEERRKEEAKMWREQRMEELERDKETKEAESMAVEDMSSRLECKQWDKRQKEIRIRREILQVRGWEEGSDS